MPDLALRIESSNTPWLGLWTGRLTDNQHQARTGPDGRFLADLPPDTILARVSSEEDKGVTFNWSPWNSRPTLRHLGILELPPKRRISGIARNADGSPLGTTEVRIAESHLAAQLLPKGFLLHEVDDFGWTLDATQRSAPSGSTAVLSTTTDRNGRFSLHGRFQDPWVTFVDASGIPHAFPCPEPHTWTSLELQAHESRESNRSFVTEDGSPAGGVDCAVAVSNCWGQHEVLAPVDLSERGKATFFSELQGDHEGGFGKVAGPSVAIRAREDLPWLVRTSYFGAKSRGPMIVPAPRDLRLRVVDPDGVPVEDVTLRPAEDLHPAFEVFEVPDSSVHFERLSPGVFVGRHVPGTDVELIVEAPGFMWGATGWTPYEFADFNPGWHAEKTLELHRAREVEVQLVSGPDARPVAAAPIQLSPWTNWSSHEPVCEQHEFPFLGNRGVTDDEGVWRPGPVCARGAWFGALAGSSVVEDRWDGETARFILRAGPLVEFSGVVLQDGAPAPDFLMSIEGAETRATGYVRTDARGRFDTSLQPDTYVIASGEVQRPLQRADGSSLSSMEVRADSDLRNLRLSAPKP